MTRDEREMIKDAARDTNAVVEEKYPEARLLAVVTTLVVQDQQDGVQTFTQSLAVDPE